MSETGTDAASGSAVETDGGPDDLSRARDEAERLTTRILELRELVRRTVGVTGTSLVTP